MDTLPLITPQIHQLQFKYDELRKHREFLQGHVIDEPKPWYRHSKRVQPDQWFDTVQVCYAIPDSFVTHGHRLSIDYTKYGMLPNMHPLQVWEVETADLLISPVYTAAAGIVS